MLYAIVRDGLVENICEWDGVTEWAPPEGTAAIPGTADTYMGGTYDGEKFWPPPEPQPVAAKTTLQQLEERIAALEAKTV